jgi:hypothetical protein
VSATPPNPNPSTAGELTEYYRSILHRLIDIGATIAGRLEHRQGQCAGTACVYPPAFFSHPRGPCCQ